MEDPDVNTEAKAAMERKQHAAEFEDMPKQDSM